MAYDGSYPSSHKAPANLLQTQGYGGHASQRPQPPYDDHQSQYIEQRQYPVSQQQPYSYDRQNHDSQRGQQQGFQAMAGDYQQSQLGATFYPGSQDDYYMPELVSPIPQRVMPEVPSNMQEGLAHLELEAREVRSPTQMASHSSIPVMQLPPLDQRTKNRGPYQTYQHQTTPSYTASYENTNASAYQNISQGQQAGGRDQDSPKFSPFPKIRDPGGNVPLSDDEKEEVLDKARPLVLQSSDPEMQLAWAQDALSWVEVASQSYIRQQAETQTTRSVTPKVEHQLRVDAMNIVIFLAEQHHPKAEFMKGMWREFGKFGYRVDKKEAFLSYRRAAAKAYARAEYRIGMQYENTMDFRKAIQHYQKGVEMGDSAANYRLGMMTLLGQYETPQDYQRGIDLISKSAATADENAPQGAYVYGMLLARELAAVNVPDRFLPYDLNDAKMFIEKAAYLGFGKAQLKMGQAYELCQLGCDFDPAMSLHYNALAARQGEAEADMAISKWFLCGYEDIFTKNEELAFTYARRAAQTKMPTAEFAMGYFYEIGMYVPVDLRKSESWYAKAAEHGNKDALGRIDSIKKNKALTKEDAHQIAISRIKSQYGSQRGGRPDRFKQKAAPLPSMVEERQTGMPERVSHSAASGQLYPQTGQLPPRSQSAAPYPEDDRPTTAPYPNTSLRPHSQAGPAADRPSSAFGIRPPLTHTATESQNDRRLAPETLKPVSTAGPLDIPGGRGINPAERVRNTSGGWESQGPTKYGDSSLNRPPTLPQIDLSRPMNLNPAANKLQKTQPSNPIKPYPQTPPNSQPYPQTPLNTQTPKPYPPTPQDSQSSHGSGSSVAVQRPPTQGYSQTIPRRDPQASQLKRPERVSSTTPAGSSGIQTGNHAANPVVNAGPGRFDSVHGQVQNANRVPSRPTTAMSSQTAQSSIVPPAIPTPAAPPRKAGPQTFEEMGVLRAKDEGECIVM